MERKYEVKKDLSELSSFPERVNYLLEENWEGTNSAFYHRFNIGKTTFYRVIGDKMPKYSDYVIEMFARAFGVSTKFLKHGGTERGYYKPKMLKRQVLKEDETPYGLGNERNRKKNTLAVAKADVEFRLDKKEEVIEILMKLKEGEIFL